MAVLQLALIAAAVSASLLVTCFLILWFRKRPGHTSRHTSRHGTDVVVAAASPDAQAVLELGDLAALDNLGVASATGTASGPPVGNEPPALPPSCPRPTAPPLGGVCPWTCPTEENSSDAAGLGHGPGWCDNKTPDEGPAARAGAVASGPPKRPPPPVPVPLTRGDPSPPSRPPPPPPPPRPLPRLQAARAAAPPALEIDGGSLRREGAER